MLGNYDITSIVKNEISRLSYIFSYEDEVSLHVLKNLLIKNHCEVIVLWKSKFANEIFTLTEPKIIDAYDMLLLSLGSPDNIKRAINNFKLRFNTIKYLEKCYGKS